MKLFKVGLISFFAMYCFAATANQYHQTQDDILVVEAEKFSTQHRNDKRKWLVFSTSSDLHSYHDPDPFHFVDASNGQYIEILPDTRANHGETLIRGENFSETPGEIAVLSYPVHFESAGKYYVWARAYSTGTEDNGLHFGLNGDWPESGKRLQLCEDKNQWTWSSAQRVPDNHCGTPQTITLNIPSSGVHTIMISMREDGFELDKFILTQDKNFIPQGQGPAETLSKVISSPAKQN